MPSMLVQRLARAPPGQIMQTPGSRCVTNCSEADERLSLFRRAVVSRAPCIRLGAPRWTGSRCLQCTAFGPPGAQRVPGHHINH
jgi:hypothetical protein